MSEETQTCLKCGEGLSLTEFYRDYVRNRVFKTCKSCVRTRSLQNIHERIEEARRFIDEVKSKPCLDCGRSWPPEAMDLDHIPGRGKVKNISRLVRDGKLKAVMDEVEKCELVCACCHRIRTAKRRAQGPG